MRFKLVTPERTVVEADVEAVYATTTDGEVGILPRHVPLLSPLGVGLLRFVQNGQSMPAAVMGGVLHTDGTEVTVLAETAELGSDIDKARAQDAKKRAEQRLASRDASVDADRASMALRRALVRLKALG
jgi:F-type H+-transporting ATPase subunit epsilon